MIIREIQTEGEWNIFLEKIKPNTFLQSWQWGAVQQKAGEKVYCLGFYEGDIQIGAALVIAASARRGNFLLCPHGPVCVDEKTVLSNLPVFTDYLKKIAKQHKAVAIRLAPLLLDTPDNEKAFTSLGYRSAPLHIHAELTWMLDISKPEDILLSEMRKTTRHAIKKADEVGVKIEIVRDANALKRFWPLYQSTTVRHGFIPFSKEFIKQQLIEFSAKDQMFVVIASHEGRDLAGAVLIHMGTTVFYYHGASKKVPSSIPAAQALQWAAIKEAKKRGATSYNFWGIAPEERPKHPFAGITVFKKGFGGYALPYLHAQDLPTSLLYWKLWAVEMYRKYKRGF